MLGRKKKPLWAPELNELPDDENSAAMVAIYFLATSRSGMKKARIFPEKDPLAFEALVARVSVPFLNPLEDASDVRALFDVGHCLRDGATVLSGSQLSRGPYGDLLYRVEQGCSTVVHRAYKQWVGQEILLDPANTVPPPKLRLFLNALAARYADALAGDPAGTWDEDNVPQTLSRLSALPVEPPIITAVKAAAQPFALSVHGPDWFLSEADVFDMTRDAELARSLGNADPV